MAGNPFYQSLDPYAVPDAVTPHDTPSSPDGYAGVTPAGIGPAPYDIAAPQPIAAITAAFNAATALTGGQEGAPTGAGMPQIASPRQREALNALNGPQGAPTPDILSGFPDYESADVRYGADLETPIQGQMGTYPVANTYQPGVTQFTSGFGSPFPGVTPDSGSMRPSGGLDYPGTTQDGITKYGTS